MRDVPQVGCQGNHLFGIQPLTGFHFYTEVLESVDTGEMKSAHGLHLRILRCRSNDGEDPLGAGGAGGEGHSSCFFFFQKHVFPAVTQ